MSNRNRYPKVAGPTRRELLALLALSSLRCGGGREGAESGASSANAGSGGSGGGSGSGGGAGGGSGGPKSVLVPSDLVFRGYYRYPAAMPTDMTFSTGGFTLRQVGTETRVLVWGNQVDFAPLHELILPEEPPGPIETAPAMILKKDWGNIRAGHVLTAANSGNDNNVPSAMYWDAARNVLWWNYTSDYVPAYFFPNLSCTILNDEAGTFESYGPWRVQAGLGPTYSAQMVQGNFTPIPPDFAAAYTGGSDFAFSGFLSSGVAGCPFGPSLYAGNLFDPTTTPTDVLDGTQSTVMTKNLIHHDQQHRKTRDKRSATCGWNVKYDCAGGSEIIPDDGLWGGVMASTADDNTNVTAWIDLPDKHGILYFGTLVRSPDGYFAPGDPRGLAHRWYGDPFVQNPPQTCCHGQDDPNWGATGDGSHYRQPMGWIYDPDSLVAVLNGEVDPWAVTPATDAFELRELTPDFDRRLVYERLGGGYFDAAARRLYVMYKFDSFTQPDRMWPALAVFDIR
jgi:hypothetical protein